MKYNKKIRDEDKTLELVLNRWDDKAKKKRFECARKFRDGNEMYDWAIQRRRNWKFA